MKTSRRRHILFQIHCSEKISEGDWIVQTIRENLHSLFGEIVVADSKLYLEEYLESTGKGILQCEADVLRQVLASAALVNEIGKREVSFQPLKTSGTLKTLQSKL
ncbi:MAG: hypothetical protein GF411_05150 [Candidatus Lokiarchaeota archaeon]|nr:hypothetical protein [Candidatus Lokiarchaeota archaeon]